MNILSTSSTYSGNKLGFVAEGLHYIFTTRDCSVENRVHTHIHTGENRHEFEVTLNKIKNSKFQNL